MARKKPAPAPLPPTAPEFRAACHAMVDRYLDDHPGTEVAIFAGDNDRAVNCASVPSALSTKQGMIDLLYSVAHGDTDAPPAD